MSYLFLHVKLMGHNEDGDKMDVNTTYLVHARIADPAQPQTVQEFTALCYPGQICGNAFGFNLNTGLVCTSNAVFPKNVNTSAVRKHASHKC